MKTPSIYGDARRDTSAPAVASRSDLLERVGRWTQQRKIKLCRGLCDEVAITSEVMVAHGLGQDEIDRWMDAYKRKDFEALKVGYSRKRTGL